LGPTSAISLVIGTVIVEQAGGDPERAAAIGSLSALLVGAIAVAAWLLRLGSVVNFVSETVLAGFKGGAALVIASTQLPKLFSLAAQGDGFFGDWRTSRTTSPPRTRGPSPSEAERWR
jgi:MFS superfamily sulfate permease-like transporter